MADGQRCRRASHQGELYGQGGAMKILHSGSQRLHIHSVAAVLALALFAAGCSHTLEVKNMQLYKPAFVNLQGKSISVGVSAVTSTPEEERLVMAGGNN